MPPLNKTRAAVPKFKQKQLPQFYSVRLHSKKVGKEPNWSNLNQKPLMVRAKRRIASDRTGTLQPREISVEISLWNRGEERADDNGSSGEGGKDWRIDIQREKRWNGGKDQKIHTSMEINRERRIHRH
ncbi:MAG: hypothetical protein EZS28_035759 [Streblomastix strix]|uniref:Uncharacterized protein n=1 Tax=Streblomastix strix TaxID=222440 RepID=A0A5J4UD55_9EUKA|nr:MAG: hypothetical protein EZS28_035759 [Streblomastix strix]